MSPAGLNRGDSRWHTDCVRDTRTQPLICVGCSVHYWVSCAIYKGGFFEIAFVVDTHLPRFEAITYVLPHFDALTHVVVRVSLAFIFAICIRKAYLSNILLWIKPSNFQHGSSLSLENVCVSWCMHQWNRVVSRRPLCHKVNIPSCVAGQSLCHKVNLTEFSV